MGSLIKNDPDNRAQNKSRGFDTGGKVPADGDPAVV